MSTEIDTRELLREAAARVPVQPPPYDVLISGGTTMRRRRRTGQVLGAATATTALAVGVIVLWPAAGPVRPPSTVAEASTGTPDGGTTGDKGLAADPTTPVDELVEPEPLLTADGRRYIGAGPIMVAVPPGLSGSASPACDGTILVSSLNTTFGPGTHCNVTSAWDYREEFLEGPFSVPRVHSVQFLYGQEPVAGETVKVGDLVAVRTPVKEDELEATGVVQIPGLDLTIVVRAPRAQPVEQTLDSLALVPDGYVVLPDSTVEDADDFKRQLQALGLTAQVSENFYADAKSPDGSLSGTNPGISSVVAEGSHVTLHILRTDH